SRMFKRQRIDLFAAEKALQEYSKIPILGVEIDLTSAVRLSHKLNVYAYDAYVIDCALKRGVPLISLDGGLLEACRRAKVEIIEVKE
ncbi:MAG: type II toxin-antitoxin system VapC family toxin, partial [Ketobacter sp.]|nr:type II toxin-antitoxin system VapC family toxin [Ketobacter sp.]